MQKQKRGSCFSSALLFLEPAKCIWVFQTGNQYHDFILGCGRNSRWTEHVVSGNSASHYLVLQLFPCTQSERFARRRILRSGG